MVLICGKVVSLHRFTHAEPTLQDVGAATGREHYILECVADALFLAIRNYHNRISCQEHCRGWCCG